jgi:prophage tail gpP-like protein
MNLTAQIEVDGTQIGAWTNYAIDSDLLVPSDGFKLSVELPEDPARRRELRDLTSPGKQIRIYLAQVNESGDVVQRYRQMVGIIDDRGTTSSREKGTIYTISGRDLIGHLLQASVALDVEVRANMTLVSLVEAALLPYGIGVATDSYAARTRLQAGRARARERARSAGVGPRSYTLTAQAEADRTGRPIDEILGVDSDTSPGARSARAGVVSGYANSMSPSDIARLSVRDARPQVGETVWAFIERHTKRLGVLAWLSPVGTLVLSSPRYEQRPRYAAVRRNPSDPAFANNVLSGGLNESIGDRHSSVTVYGRGNPRNSERRIVTGTATDDAWPADMDKPLIIQDASIRSGAVAARRALRELMARKESAFTLEYVLDGHGSHGHLFAIDTTIAVVDEESDVRGVFYVVRRQFNQDRQNGTTTNIRCVPRGALVF